ncbi:FAD-binding oxidoreductase [Nocardioides sambongensis]|uniref:FAD-binding oxidoreductase n=1 Tax=Nocardioides sambongensis TaxID=2589074 RepID=UPI001E44F927|nr:FAD-binding oxidoreductase [Nocardioides sambongensis]
MTAASPVPPVPASVTPGDLQPEMPPTRWGDPAAAGPLPAATRGLVDLVFGHHDTPARDRVDLPAPDLAPYHLVALRGLVGEDHVLLDDDLRRRRTRGKSTPDLLRQREGDLADAPDVVLRPADHDQVVAVLGYCAEHRIAVVPFGGGTCVTGGLVAERGDLAGVVSLDLGRLRRLLALDPVSATATLEPGLRGPEAEALLAERGMMLGHYPQSFQFASIGGFAATRSSGQSSAGYGRFDAMVVGLRVATPAGEVRLGTAPANAAGPDLRQLFLGSEGTLGVITEVTVRVRPLPEVKVYEGWRWPDFATGSEAMRQLAQSDLLPTVLRLSDEAETAINLADPESVGGEEAGSTGCLMIVGYEGTAAAVAAKQRAVTDVLAAAGGAQLGTEPGESWAHGRFDAPYLRDGLLDAGVLVETLETATFWSNRDRLYTAVKEALTAELGEGTLVLCHVSHVYPTGCSLYFTVATPGGTASHNTGDTDTGAHNTGAHNTGTHNAPLERWLPAKAAACAAIVATGASITHHHAIGTDHKPYLVDEIGEVGVTALRALKQALDPAGILNPGVLIP